MPYKSDAQRRFFHSLGAKQAGIKKGVVEEFDNASKGIKIPAKVSLPKFDSPKEPFKGAEVTQESDSAPGQRRFKKIMSLFKGNK